MVAFKVLFENMKKFIGLPGIQEYLSANGSGQPIEISEVDHFADAIVAYCGLTKEQSQRILMLFFQEIRSTMLQGDVVDIRGLGSFLVSSPATTKNSKKVFPQFKAKKSFIKRMNNE